MTEGNLKYTVGIFLIASHIGLICYAMALFFQNGYNMDELTTVMAVVTPVFAGYTTSIIAFIIKNSKATQDTTVLVNLPYIILTLALPALLVGVIAIAIGLKAHNQAFANFEDFKRFLLLVESLFAAYVGMFVYSLFEKQAAQGIVTPSPPHRQS